MPIDKQKTQLQSKRRKNKSDFISNHLGVYLTHTLTRKTYLFELIPKLNRPVGLLSKVRYYTTKSLPRTIYYPLFNSHFIYACQTWRQSKIVIFNKIQKLQARRLTFFLQDKALRISNFLLNTVPASEIYKTSKILRLHLIAKCFTSEKLF